MKNTIPVLADTLSLGQRIVKVEISDGQGGKAGRTWTFRRTNSTSMISGTDTNLGNKNLGFTYEYTIDNADGDELTVTEQLNGDTLRAISNAPRKETLPFTVDAEKLYPLGLNTMDNIVTTITDGKGGTIYRHLTFKRIDGAPTISGQDKNVGLQTGGSSEKYTVNDVEGDNVAVTEFVDDRQIRSYKVTFGQEEMIELSRESWFILTNGDHQLRIKAIDGNFATSAHVFASQKEETVICFQLSEPEETDVMATRVLVTPTWTVEGATAKVEACNNTFDNVPTQEDITAQIMINRVFMFQNRTKTAEKWGIDTRLTITKNEGYEGEVSISGFGGVYE